MMRPRFSLRGLLFAMTALGLFMGVSQVRRHEMQRQAEELKDDGAEFVLRDSWRDLLWQRLPVDSLVRIQHLPTKEFVLGSRRFNRIDAEQHVDELVERLEQFGLTKEQIIILDDGTFFTVAPNGAGSVKHQWSVYGKTAHSSEK